MQEQLLGKSGLYIMLYITTEMRVVLLFWVRTFVLGRLVFWVVLLYGYIFGRSGEHLDSALYTFLSEARSVPKKAEPSTLP